MKKIHAKDEVTIREAYIHKTTMPILNVNRDIYNNWYEILAQLLAKYSWRVGL